MIPAFQIHEMLFSHAMLQEYEEEWYEEERDISAHSQPFLDTTVLVGISPLRLKLACWLLEEPTKKKKKKKGGASGYDEWQSRRLVPLILFAWLVLLNLDMLATSEIICQRRWPCSSWYAEGGDSWNALTQVEM